MNLTCHRVADFDQLDPTDRALWNRLPLPTPMQSATWLESWWRTFGRDAGHQLCLLQVKQSGQDPSEPHPGQLVGIAPFYVVRSGWGKRTLRLLGDGVTCSDHMGIVATREHRQAVARQVANWLLDSASTVWDTIEFDSVPADDPTRQQVRELLQQGELTVRSRDRVGCWAIELPNSLEAYLASLSKNHRKRCRRWIRNYFENDRVEVGSWNATQIDTAWETLDRLNRQRRDVVGDRSSFLDKQFSEFHRSVLPELMKSNQVELSYLKLDGQIMAVEYLLRDSAGYSCYQSGLAMSDNKDGLGNLSILAMIMRAIEQGMTKVDFLRGDEDYKAHWNAVRTACVTEYIASKSIQGLADSARHQLIDQARVFRDFFASPTPTAP